MLGISSGFVSGGCLFPWVVGLVVEVAFVAAVVEQMLF